MESTELPSTEYFVAACLEGSPFAQNSFALSVDILLSPMTVTQLPPMLDPDFNSKIEVANSLLAKDILASIMDCDGSRTVEPRYEPAVGGRWSVAILAINLPPLADSGRVVRVLCR